MTWQCFDCFAHFKPSLPGPLLFFLLCLGAPNGPLLNTWSPPRIHLLPHLFLPFWSYRHLIEYVCFLQGSSDREFFVTDLWKCEVALGDSNGFCILRAFSNFGVVDGHSYFLFDDLPVLKHLFCDSCRQLFLSCATLRRNDDLSGMCFNCFKPHRYIPFQSFSS